MSLHLNPHLRGIGFALAGFTSWVVADALIKFAAESHLAPYQIIGIMSAVAVVVMLFKARRVDAIKALWPKSMKGQIIVALMTLGSNYCNVIALRHLPLTIFYIAVFTAPMLIAILSAYFLKEPLGWLKFLAIVIGFFGVVVAIDPFDVTSGGDLIGYAAAFGSSSCFAVNVTLTRFLTQSESPDSLVFFNSLFQVFVSAVCAVLLVCPPISLPILFILLAMGAFNLGGNFAYTLGVKYAPAATVAPFHYTQIISGTLVAFLVWHEMPKFHFWIGVVIIVATGIYIARTAYKSAQAAQAGIAPH